ncbi:MAG TPA: pyridoxal phosphate-dependent aminotransferase [Deinococcales bacterium]|nr:pyridoxal phosphate-dependent aminotransferase [Deinococcales bacterium]
MSQLSRRVSSLKPSSTLAVTARQLELKRAGVDVVSMAAGEPDFDTPEHIKAAAVQALRDGRTKYTEVQGILELREAICAKFARDNGLTYAPEQVTVTTGGKQALFNAFFAVIDPGDEVVIPAPFWVTYPEQVRLAGGEPVFVETRVEENYCLDVNALEAALTPRTKAVVLNSPGNPTGAVYPESVIRRVAELAEERGFWIVSDEIYEHIMYAGEAVSPARFAPERTVTINGASKAFSMTGWRMGFSAAPAPVAKAMNALQGQVTSNASTIGQYATLAALRDEGGATSDYISMARAEFLMRRDFIVAGLNRVGLPTPTPDGAFYVLADATRVHRDEVEATRIILDEARVAVVPGTDFLAPGRVRLSYACSLGQIGEALERISRL